MRGRTIGIALAVTLLAGACAGEATGPETGDAGAAGPSKVQVRGEEYAFGGVPGTLAAGETTFTLQNVGQEPHEFGLVLIRSEHTVDELIQMGPRAGKFIREVGRAFARPGKTDAFQLTLRPGRYGYACFVETEGTPHAVEGMYGGFTVE